MLELLFQGFIEWIYGLILECWEYFASVLFDLMSLDFAYLREHMPVIDTIRQIMLGVGWALLIGNLVFQATRGMQRGSASTRKTRSCFLHGRLPFRFCWWQARRSASWG